MSASGSIARITEYYGRHGFGATIRRASLALRRTIFANGMVVFHCDLANLDQSPAHASDSLTIERVTSEAGLHQQDRDAMIGFWNPRLAQRHIAERFAKGGSLWLAKSANQLAGYGWTLKGQTIEPYYFPLGTDDVHFFDFHVFAQFRGRGINPFLVTGILSTLATDRVGRALIEAAEWNVAQLSSLRKTPFRQLGVVRMFRIGTFRLIHWDRNGRTAPAK